jgi:hypothetical protein
VGIFKNSERLKRSISKSVPSLVTTVDKISIVDCTSVRSCTAETVVVAALVPPVIVSPFEKVPTGMVVATEVVEGLLVMLAVAALVPPVIVSPTEKLADEATESVKVPAGYSLTPEATVIDV